MSISQCMTVAAAAEPAIGVVVAAGISIVFGVLVLLYLLISLEGVIFTGIDKKKKNIAEAKTADKPADKSFDAARASAASVAVQQGIPGEVIAAISAALACMEGGSRYAIRSVTRAKQGRSAWGGAAAASYTEPF